MVLFILTLLMSVPLSSRAQEASPIPTGAEIATPTSPSTDITTETLAEIRLPVAAIPPSPAIVDVWLATLSPGQVPCTPRSDRAAPDSIRRSGRTSPPAYRARNLGSRRTGPDSSGTGRTCSRRLPPSTPRTCGGSSMHRRRRCRSTRSSPYTAPAVRCSSGHRRRSCSPHRSWCSHHSGVDRSRCRCTTDCSTSCRAGSPCWCTLAGEDTGCPARFLPCGAAGPAGDGDTAATLTCAPETRRPVGLHAPALAVLALLARRAFFLGCGGLSWGDPDSTAHAKEGHQHGAARARRAEGTG